MSVTLEERTATVFEK